MNAKAYKMLKSYSDALAKNERSSATIEKYTRNRKRFFDWIGERELSKELVIQWKATLTGAPSSINGEISAVNSLLVYLGHADWKVRQVKTQRRTYRAKEKNLTKTEFERLVRTAEAQGNYRLARAIETIAATGIRVSELRFITAESLAEREVTIQNKGKLRTILLTAELVKKLKAYCRQAGIRRGEVFVTRSGRSLARTQIWAEMKKLCEAAGVEPGKVFPHNFRHLFAVVHYRLHKDIAKLADLLGHSSVNTTRIYLIDTGEEHRRQLEAMHMVI